MKQVQVVFDGLAIRDTAIHYPDETVDWVNGFVIDKLTFGVINELNQDVSIQPIGRVGAAKANLGSASTISANSEGIVNLNLQNYWAPYISVSAKCTVSPTSGKLTVYCVSREK